MPAPKPHTQPRHVPIRWLILLTLLLLTACARSGDTTTGPWTLLSETTATPTPFGPIPTAAVINGTAVPVNFASPTPDPPHDLPGIRNEPEMYIVQPGDTLLQIARLYNLTVEQIIAANDLANPDYLEVGQVLQIPAPPPLATGPSFKIIPDSELVNGPSAADFNTEAFVQAAGGYLSTHLEEVEADELLTGAQIVTRVSQNYSVHPRLLLSILEHQTGWVTDPDPDEKTYAIGLIDPVRDNLYRQLTWTADTLNRGYYLWRVEGVAAWSLWDGSLIPVNPAINAGTASVQHFFAQLYGFDGWLAKVGEDGLFATWSRLFGYPFSYSIEPLIPASLAQPTFQLPFAPGDPWSFTGGPHGGWDDGSAWAALDFAPPGEALGCVQNNSWVTAVAAGVIVRTGYGQVILDLDGDGLEQTGWVVLYMHIESRGRVQPGKRVEAGDRLGHPSCEGGYSTGTHLHLARKYNGEWIPADQPGLPFVMDGWVSTGAGSVYDGWLVKGNRSIEAENGRSEQNEISR